MVNGSQDVNESISYHIIYQCIKGVHYPKTVEVVWNNFAIPMYSGSLLHNTTASITTESQTEIYG